MSPARDPAESALVARAQDGDTRAFEELVRKSIGPVRRFARGFARNQADADDLAQEALVKAYRSIRGYRFQAAFSTWLFTVVRSVFLDQKKSRAGRNQANEVEYESHTALVDSEGPPPPDQELARAEDRQALWTAIARVPQEFRTVLVLFDIEGLSHDEIAAVEGIAVGTVKSRLSRARGHLRAILTTAGNLPAGSVVQLTYTEES